LNFAIMQRTYFCFRLFLFSVSLSLAWAVTFAQERPARVQLPPGLVYVSQKIDLRQQLSAEETVYSLDGEPLPQLQTTSLTLGLLLNDSGHIVTRLANFSPQDAPPQLMVILAGNAGGQFPATFVGMDSVTGLCLLKVARLPATFSSAATKTAALSNAVQKPIQLFGFNPRQRGTSTPGMTLLRPRLYNSVGVVKKATEDFRYSVNNPIYYLTAPTTLTPVQDCSVAVEKDGSVLGLVMYDTSGEETHLVYPLSRVQQIATMIFDHKRFVVPHAWLGATSGAHDPNAMSSRNKLTEEERGVLIAAVFPDSPAEMAGVRPRDMLVSISGRTLVTGADLSSTLRLLPACSEVTLKVRRGNEFKLLPARLAPAPATDAKQLSKYFLSQIEKYEEMARELPANDPNRDKNQSKANNIKQILNGIINPAPPEIWLKLMYGVEVIALTPQLAKAFAAPGGVLISTLTPSGKAAQAGLKVGDIIVKVGEDAVADPASFMQALSQNTSDERELLIVRAGETLPLNLPK
jgi:S1-C subfamily serine protease